MKTESYKAYRRTLEEWEVEYGETTTACTSNSATPIAVKKPKDPNGIYDVFPFPYFLQMTSHNSFRSDTWHPG